VDAGVLRLEPAHWPLVWMLVLTQTATGMLLVTWLTALIAPQSFAVSKGALALCGFILLQLGLAASVFHLGRPLGAWRAFLGLRRSWMSREIVAFAFFTIATGLFVLSAFSTRIAGLCPVLAGIAALLGFVSVFSSAMIYVDTPRISWTRAFTFPRFFGTTLLLGAAGAACVLGWTTGSKESVRVAGWAATAIRTALFGWEAQLLLRSLDVPSKPSHSAALLAWQFLKPVFVARIALFVASTCFGLLGIFMSGRTAICFATIAFVATFSSQIIERYCFFVTAAAPRMPGGTG
jgi:formate dehydrogenase iron-sulfur subunit